MRMGEASVYGVGRSLRSSVTGNIRQMSLLLFQLRNCPGIVLCLVSHRTSKFNMGTNVLASSGTVVPPLYNDQLHLGLRPIWLTVIRTTRFPSTAFHLSTKACTRAVRSSSPAGGFCVWKYDSVLNGVDGILPIEEGFLLLYLVAYNYLNAKAYPVAVSLCRWT